MQSLLNGELLAIHLSQLIDALTSQKPGEQIIDKGFDRYVNAPSTGRIGMAFYEAENPPERIVFYFCGISRPGHAADPLELMCCKPIGLSSLLWL